MARTDSLKNFLTDIANSIKRKSGITEPILAVDFDKEIDNLSSSYMPRQISFAGYEGEELDDELSKLSFDNITSMKYMFYNCQKLKRVDLSNFSLPSINNIGYMFYNCTSLVYANLKSLNTSNVTTLAYLFNQCTSLEEIDLSNFDTSNVTSMERVFFGCSNLKRINLSSWNTIKVTSMTYMFANCSKLERLDIRNFDFSKVDSNGTYLMFSGVPKNCLIIVKDDALKTKVQKVFGTATNIKSVAELTDEEL